MSYKHRCNVDNADAFSKWLSSRGGLLLWEAADFTPMSWSTPATTEAGDVMGQPTWRCKKTPTLHITDAADIEVFQNKEIRRFKVAHKPKPDNGLMRTLTDHSDRKLRVALDLAGPDSTYEFDYASGEAVILVSETMGSLATWREKPCS